MAKIKGKKILSVNFICNTEKQKIIAVSSEENT
jgi:hypothetical protein